MNKRTKTCTSQWGASRSNQFVAALVILPLLLVSALLAYNRVNVTTSGPANVDGANPSRLVNRLDTSLNRTLENAQQERMPRIAILVPQSDSNAEESYLAEGLAFEVHNQLLGIPGVELVGRQSIDTVLQQQLPLPTAAQLLDATHLLRGRYRRNAHGLAIEMELIAATDAMTSLWTERWPTSVESLAITVQSIAARTLETLVPDSRKNEEQDTPTPQALDAFLRGKYLAERYNMDDVLEGLSFFDQAIGIDPNFDRAYSEKIGALQRMTWVDAGQTKTYNQMIDRVVNDYLSLNRESALTYRLKSREASLSHRALEAYSLFRQAQQIEPITYQYDRAFMTDLCKAGYLRRCLEQAQGLTRADPLSATAHSELARAYLMLGDYEPMIEHARLSSRFGGELGDYYEAQYLFYLGRIDEAETLYRAAIQPLGISDDWVSAFLVAYTQPEKTSQAISAMTNVDEESAVWFDLFYVEYILLGEIDRAYQAADQLIQQRFKTWSLWMWDDYTKAFRSDPRFIDIARRLGYVELWQKLGPPDVCLGDQPDAFCARINEE
ncbi:MAG: hypothetical protein AAF465_14750 [Pseudomonadota bacterium]